MKKPERLTQLIGVGQVTADRIRKYLGNNDEEKALRALERNPYDLLDVPRIGFKTADKIAYGNYQFGLDRVERHHAGNAHLLADKGSLERREFDQARAKLELQGVNYRFTGVILDEGRVWLPKVLEAEKNLAQWALNLPLNLALSGVRGQLSAAQEAALDGLDAVQRQAALNAVRGHHKVLAITGGAGTGKTKVISALARLAEATDSDVGVLAPTGKAADRAREALLSAGAYADAMTIHRALGYPVLNTTILPWHIVVIDESSMVSVDLLWEVVKRLPPRGRLILVGDPGQLPPVGHGQPFSDLLKLGLPHVHLLTNHRQKDVQGIIKLAEGIRARRQPVAEDFADGSVELKLLPADQMDAAATAAIAAKKGQPLDNWQIITWMNEDVHMLNEGTQSELNPDGYPVFTYRPYGWPRQMEVRAGDKVVVMSTDPDYGIFNGQLGVVRDLQMKERVVLRAAKTLDEFTRAGSDGMVADKYLTEMVLLDIAGSRMEMPVSDAEGLLRLGYAITVHKAQGSDWEHVLLLQPREIAFDAARWWYTSVTRARSKLSVFFICKSEAKFWMNVRRTVMQEESTLTRRFKKLIDQHSVNVLQLGVSAQTGGPLDELTAEEWLA